MKNTIVVLIIVLLSLPVYAQPDNKSGKSETQFLNSGQKKFGLIHIDNKHWNYKEFMTGYTQLLQAGKKSTTKRVTFMDGPVIYSFAPGFENNKNPTVPYQKYGSLYTDASAALHLLGIASSIAAAAFLPNYSQQSNLYLNSSRATEDAYLRSTYRKEGWIPVQ